MINNRLCRRLLLGLFLLSAAAQAAHPLYGDKASYTVFRGDIPVGTHELLFSSENDTLAVKASTRATMRFFGLFDIPFVYDSSALWQENTLLSLSSSFYRGGAQQAYEVNKADKVYSNQNNASQPAPIFPTNHWNIAALQQTVWFNTLNGKFINVIIQPAGEEVLQIGDSSITTTRYDVSGDLVISLWYDKSGKWLQLQFSVLGSDYIFTYTPPAKNLNG